LTTLEAASAKRGGLFFSRLVVATRLPVLTMIVAATAIPVELRVPSRAALGSNFFATEFLANIVGYIPAGVVLSGLGSAAAVLVSAAIATLAEIGQLFMAHRDPSVVDIAANALGAAIGAVACARTGFAWPFIGVTRTRALLAAIIAAVIVVEVRMASAYPSNDRGWAAPGTLEAYWKFDEEDGRTAVDSSGHDHHGRFRGASTHVTGQLGRAIALDGRREYVDFGRSSALRLDGSMTITAWINPASFPVDDAAIVSNHNGVGYQLDTTIDSGPRTIGFKLGNACGDLMARYGATPLETGAWYHVAGVYDARARTLDVYLNGKLDDGLLQGTVTSSQRPSREAVYVGRRSDEKGFEFAGAIDDARIYSRALTREVIVTALSGGMPLLSGEAFVAGRSAAVDGRSAGLFSALLPNRCPASVREDAALPGIAVALGVLVAFACSSLWPRSGTLALALSVLAGVGLLYESGSTVPALGRLLVPLTSLAGGMSVRWSLAVRDLER
jgi:hypothetical protein